MGAADQAEQHNELARQVGIQFNVVKCKVMHLGSRNRQQVSGLGTAFFYVLNCMDEN